MSNLKVYLEQCKVAYYGGDPIISDSQYDALEEACSEDLSVGTNKGRVRHWYRMYSLQKLYQGDPMPGGIYFITPKLDGASLSLRYVNGWLESIVTRGDGEYGEDVTHLFTAANCDRVGIPYNTEHNITGQITGELVAKKDITNARNYAAGALNLKDSEQFSNREVKFFAYDMQETQFGTYLATLCYMRDIGFKTVYTSKDVDEYPQDGMVHRLDLHHAYKEAGFTSKHPRGAFALKERSEGVKTILLRVDWQTGKSGKVTPVAILDEVDIGGAKVSRATLNNPGFIEALDLHIGDCILVERAGGIIPRIIRKV